MGHDLLCTHNHTERHIRSHWLQSMEQEPMYPMQSVCHCSKDHCRNPGFVPSFFRSACLVPMLDLDPQPQAFSSLLEALLWTLRHWWCSRKSFHLHFFFGHLAADFSSLCQPANTTNILNQLLKIQSFAKECLMMGSGTNVSESLYLKVLGEQWKGNTHHHESYCTVT